MIINDEPIYINILTMEAADKQVTVFMPNPKRTYYGEAAPKKQWAITNLMVAILGKGIYTKIPTTWLFYKNLITVAV